MKQAIRIIAAVAALLQVQASAIADGGGVTSVESLRASYDEALASGLYGEAEVAAKTLLDRALGDGRQNDLATAELLNDLAEAQRLNLDFDAALQNYGQAIAIIESRSNNLDIALAEPLLGTGYVYLHRERPDLALPILEKALHVRQVNQGLHSMTQFETLGALVDAYRMMGRMDEAVDVADRIVLLHSRNFQDVPVEVIPALLRKAQILGEMKNWREERNLYNEAIMIAERNGGKDSPELVRPFILYGQSHTLEYFDKLAIAKTEKEKPDERLLGEAETYFSKALELARDYYDVDWRIFLDALLAMGDFYTMTEKPGRARLLYVEAWELLTDDDAKLAQRYELLEKPVLLFGPLPDLAIAVSTPVSEESTSQKFGVGYIVVQFTVTRRGRLADLGLVEIDPGRNHKIEAEVKRALGRYVYRPRFENGFVIESAGQQLRFEFPYAGDAG
ncbi:MAG: tetratricopeptide repeat protein [Gammaproteobacteria bacterium]|nr:tetratricopeptide repeat protein [Gammaproteobacteria bacterium]